MKKNILITCALILSSFSSFALDKTNLIDKSEKLFDCSELVDQKNIEILESIKKDLITNPTFILLSEKEEKKQKLTRKEEQEIMKIQLQFYKASQELNIAFFNNSLECVKQSFPKFPDLELNKDK